jgi:hypothetical protein
MCPILMYCFGIYVDELRKIIGIEDECVLLLEAISET